MTKIRNPASDDSAGLHELQHFAELGRLSASLLHEISNPLTAAILHLEQAADRHSPSIRRAWRDIQLLRRYVEAARQQVRNQSQVTSFEVRYHLNQIKRVVGPIAKNAQVDLVFEPMSDYRLRGDPIQFQHILTNLIVNAIDAYSHDTAPDLAKPIRVSVTSHELWLIIRVTDWGHGIAACKLAAIFEPFYSTKSHAGHGLGIGLSIVKQSVVNHFGGSIRVTSSRRYGTSFIVSLPLKRKLEAIG